MASAAAVALWEVLWEWVDEGASFWAVVEEWRSYTSWTGSTPSEKEHLISVRTAMRSGGGRIIAVVVVRGREKEIADDDLFGQRDIDGG